MIHETAVIEPGAELGENVRVGPYAHIETGTEIGDGCVIGSHATIMRFTKLGSECSVHAGAVLGDLPQDLGFEGGDTYLRVGDGCLIREGVTLHRGTKPGTATEIGDNCFLMAFSHCAHNVKLGNHVILANAVLLAGYVQVGDSTFIGGGAGIHQYVRIGRLAMIGGNAGVSKDVPPFCTVEPVGLNIIAGLNVVGLRRGGLTPDERKEIKEAYRILFRSGLNNSDAKEKIRETFTSGPALELADFIDEAERGICAARR
jgi:UDP-N-acetylglucosamine acyltransferase